MHGHDHAGGQAARREGDHVVAGSEGGHARTDGVDHAGTFAAQRFDRSRVHAERAQHVPEIQASSLHGDADLARPRHAWCKRHERQIFNRARAGRGNAEFPRVAHGDDARSPGLAVAQCELGFPSVSALQHVCECHGGAVLIEVQQRAVQLGALGAHHTTKSP